MKKIILMTISTLFILTGCAKGAFITFEAEIESIGEGSMMVITDDEVRFEKASVGMRTAKTKGNLAIGEKVSITIEPDIRESYPVQVTAKKVEVVEASYQKITPEEAKAMIDEGEYDVLLDVRTLEEYNQGHIEGATLLPDNEIKEKAEATLYDKEQAILIYCRSGRRSEAAAKQLIELGYTHVYDFGGIMDWTYEIVKE